MDPKRVLVVDDDSSVSRVLVRVFERAGFQVACARDGCQALDLLTRDRFDVLVCDIQMPRMTGRELCEHCASEGPALPAQVFIVTSRAGDEERAWVKKFPGVTLVEKPAGPKQLLRMVTRQILSETGDSLPTDQRRVA